jgi:peroxiredoxin Q/BCP
MAVRKKAAKKAARKSAKKPVKKSAKKAVKKKAAPTAAKKPAAAKSQSGSRPSFLGKAAPAFTMPTDDGKTISLSDFKGQRVLLYFYPKDDTTGCTAQACDLRDNMATFARGNTVVIGVSKDDVTSHARFKDKYRLNYLLASDKDTGVSEKYGAWVEKNMYGRRYMGIERSTFLIDENGIVRGEWRKVNVGSHASDLKAAVAAL